MSSNREEALFALALEKPAEKRTAFLDALDVVAVNKLGDTVRCTPAIAGNRICVRGADHLWALGQ
jgi:hypothetical protein